MIVRTGEADRFVAHPPAALTAALFHGPDSGLAHERAMRLARGVVEDLADPFRVVQLNEALLLADNARLFDEAAAISMLGGRRVVWVRGAGNALAKLFERFLDAPAGDALVVVEAGDLAKGTALRRVFEENKNAACVACYPDDAGTLGDVLRNALKDEHIAITQEALGEAVAHLGSDRGVTRQEIEKLVLYAHGQKEVTPDDVRAVLGDAVEVRAEEACDAAGSGDFARLDLALERLWSADTALVAVVRAALGHFQRLLSVKVQSARGESLDSAMRRLRPPVHFARAASFRMQAQKWSEAKLADALDSLLEAEALCKTTGVPAEAATSRALLSAAALVKTNKAGA